MTHGNTPTTICGASRAVRLAFEELGKGGHPFETVAAVARRWNRELSDAQIQRVLERRPRKGRGKYEKKDEKWHRPAGWVAAFDVGDDQDDAGDELARCATRGRSAPRAVDKIVSSWGDDA